MNLLILILTAWVVMVTGCPDKESLYPCTCDSILNNAVDFVYCDNLNTSDDLVSATSSLIGQNKIRVFIIRHTALTYIPARTFKGIKFSELLIINSTFTSLTDTDEALEGLEDHLQKITIQNSILVNEINWFHFRRLNKLKKLVISEVNLETIEDMRDMPLNEMTSILMVENKINHIHRKAFAKATNLIDLHLSKNFISELKRSMFPNPAKELFYLNLGYNQITTFPEDMFTNMPKLQKLLIEHNEIHYLDEKVFSPIWNQLDNMEAAGNYFQCDCKVKWIVDRKKNYDFNAKCFVPMQLKGKYIIKLTSKELPCNTR